MTKAQKRISEVKERVIEALNNKAFGRVTVACKMANISRQTHYNWIKDDSEYEERVNQAINNPAHIQFFNDLAITGYIKNLKSGYWPAVEKTMKNNEVANFTNEKKVKVESEVPFVGFGLDFDDDTE